MADTTRGPGTIVIVSPNWLGDAVMALPAIADVRRAFPSARLVIAARRVVADLFRLVPGVDEIVTLQWKGGFWDRGTFVADVEALRLLRADLAILLPNSFATAWLVTRARIRERWGYARDMRSMLLTRARPRPTGSLHQGAYYQHLTRDLGVASGPLEPGLTISDDTRAAARNLLRKAGWDDLRPLVVFAPGAAYGTAKRWMPEYVARVVTDLVRDRQATCVLVGSAGDTPTTQEVIAMVDAQAASHVIDLSGQTTLEMLAGVLGIANGCVANDSGAMHMAAAIGTPLVAIFGPTREYETAPLTRSGGRAEVLINPVSCRPCMLRECPIDHRCMTGIPPERVYQAVTGLISSVGEK
ncbi:MAG: lipopolysaccharide heptosyltransferase II [Acidobacteria bacterium]|nr:lipopolysaccharide heptosyltransferase II [Acidobacteriota bacterium]